MQYDRKEPLWLAADFGLAAVLQLAACLLFYWVLRAPSWRRFLVLAPAAPLFLVFLNYTYLIAIPTIFLIEPDQAAEVNPWTEECSAPDYLIADVPSPPNLTMARSGQVWVYRKADSKLGVLAMPGCELTPIDLRWSNADPLISHAITGGRVVYSTRNRETNERSWWLLDGPGGEPRPIQPAAQIGYARPVLSADGEWIGGLQRVGKSKRSPGVPRVLLQRISAGAVTGEEKLIELEHLTPASFELLAADMGAGTVLVVRNHREFLDVDLDGRVRGEALRPDQVEASANSFLRAGAGWVAWDSYKDRGAYRIQWSVAGGSGIHRVLKGRGITSLAADPKGRYIAVSVHTNLSIGDIDDTVYVIRTDNGEEMFRRYLPAYSRSGVAFLGSEYFAYSESEDRDHRVRVLRIPDSER